MINERNSNVELLRIIAALFITFNHVRCSESALYINFLLKQLFLCGGQFGVNCFLIISCWFLVDSVFQIKRIIKLIADVFFYSLFLDIFAFVFLRVSFSIVVFFNGFRYWYPFAYIVMLVASPLLLKINSEKCRCISIFGGVISVIITISGVINPSLKILYLFDKGIIVGPLWFCYIFVLVRTIKYSRWINYYKKWTAFYGFVIMYTIMFIVLLFSKSMWIRNVISPICFISAFSLFRFLSELNIGIVTKINQLARCTFGVYLFQCNTNISDWLWNNLFHFYNWSERTYAWGLFAVVACVFIFLCAYLIEIIKGFVRLNHIIIKSE